MVRHKCTIILLIKVNGSLTHYRSCVENYVRFYFQCVIIEPYESFFFHFTMLRCVRQLNPKPERSVSKNIVQLFLHVFKQEQCKTDSSFNNMINYQTAQKCPRLHRRGAKRLSPIPLKLFYLVN